MSASAPRPMRSPSLLAMAGEVKSDLKLDSKSKNHPYDAVIQHLCNIETYSNMKGASGEILYKDVAAFAKNLKEKLSLYREQGRVVTTAHLQDTIKDVQRYETEVLERIKYVSAGLGADHVKAWHGPATTKAVALIVSALKEAEASCIYQPPSVESLLKGMENRYKEALKQHPRREREDITQHYNILSKRAALLLDFRSHGFSRRTTSIIGMAFAVTPTVKTPIEKYLNEAEKAGQEICEAYAVIEKDYEASCKTILAKSQATMMMMLENAILEERTGKIDFRSSQLRKLIDGLEGAQPKSKKTIRSSSARGRRFFAEERNRKQHLEVRAKLLDDVVLPSDVVGDSLSVTPVTRGRQKSHY